MYIYKYTYLYMYIYIYMSIPNVGSKRVHSVGVSEQLLHLDTRTLVRFSLSGQNDGIRLGMQLARRLQRATQSCNARECQYLYSCTSKASKLSTTQARCSELQRP